MRYLLDTNILIYTYKNQGVCRSKLLSHSAEDLCICALNVTEIERGIAKSTNPKPLRLFLDAALARYNFLPLDMTSAAIAGKLRATLEQSGIVIGPYDLLIAGIALAHNLTVVTQNTREFERVAGLRLENWYDVGQG